MLLGEHFGLFGCAAHFAFFFLAFTGRGHLAHVGGLGQKCLELALQHVLLFLRGSHRWGIEALHRIAEEAEGLQVEEGDAPFANGGFGIRLLE